MNETEQLHEFYWSKWSEIVDGLRSRQGLSAPLLLKPHGEYFSAKRKLMVVGQETNRWYVEDEPRSASMTTLHLLLDNYHDHVIKRIKGSQPFWKASRIIADCLNPDLKDQPSLAWSNIVKTDRLKKVNEKISGVRPSLEDEEWISQFNMLQEEIRILKPEVIVFFIGPCYCDRLEKTFPGVNYTRPSTASLWSPVSHPDLPIHSYLTYHPSYLWRSGRRAVIDKIANRIQSNT